MASLRGDKIAQPEVDKHTNRDESSFQVVVVQHPLECPHCKYALILFQNCFLLLRPREQLPLQDQYCLHHFLLGNFPPHHPQYFLSRRLPLTQTHCPPQSQTHNPESKTLLNLTVISMWHCRTTAIKYLLNGSFGKHWDSLNWDIFLFLTSIFSP